MSAPVFAALQCAIRAGDIIANLKLYMDFMQHAREQGVGYYSFPSYRSQDMKQPWLKLLRRISIANCSPPCDTLRGKPP
jgi:hypothetical protein